VKRALIAITMGCSLVLAGCSGSVSSRPSQPVEVEDCDADDLLERDEDCGFSKKKTTKKATPKAVKPKPKSKPKPKPRRRT
jgi:hypothetical protein